MLKKRLEEAICVAREQHPNSKRLKVDVETPQGILIGGPQNDNLDLFRSLLDASTP
jgi:hypothetical protein